MLIKGKYTTAQVYTTKNVETAIEDYAASQIQALCDEPINEGCQIAVMPDWIYSDCRQSDHAECGRD